MKQYTTSISCGGLGLRIVENICLPAFLSLTFIVSKMVKSILPVNSDNLEMNSKTAIQIMSQNDGKSIDLDFDFRF